MIIYSCIENLLQYAQSHLLLDDLDVIYTRNRLMQELRLEDYVQYETDVDAIDEMTCPDDVLTPIVDHAVEKGIIGDENREEFGDRIMDIVSLKPSEVVDMFDSLHSTSAAKAFDWLYDYSVKNDYVKQTKIAKNKHCWKSRLTFQSPKRTTRTRQSC